MGIWRTTDGGITWNHEFGGFGRVNGIAFLNSRSAIVVGYPSAIFRAQY